MVHQQDAGFDAAAPRADWPIAVLCRVMEDLKRSTPRDVLRNEIWAGAAGAASAWTRQRAYARSTAVMSMVRPWCTLFGHGDTSMAAIQFDIAHCIRYVMRHLPIWTTTFVYSRRTDNRNIKLMFWLTP